MNLLILTSFALLLESLPEATIYTGGYKGHGYRVFGKFRLNYHVPLFFRWTLTCIAVTVISEWDLSWPTIIRGASLVFAYAVVEDMGYWLWSREWPGPESWIGKMFGGFYLAGRFIPNAWWMGLVASYAIYWVMR